MIPLTGNISLKQARQDCDQSANGSHNIQLLQERALSTTVSQEALRGVACGHHQTYSPNTNYRDLDRTMGHKARYGGEMNGYAQRADNYGTVIGLERNLSIANDATYSVTSFGYCESGTYQIAGSFRGISNYGVTPEIAIQGYSTGWNSGIQSNFYVKRFNSNNNGPHVATFTVNGAYPWVSVILRSILFEGGSGTRAEVQFYKFQKMTRIS